MVYHGLKPVDVRVAKSLRPLLGLNGIQIVGLERFQTLINRDWQCYCYRTTMCGDREGLG